MATSAPARPKVDPRIGRRRAAVTRARGRRRLRVLVAAAAAVVLSVGALLLLHSRLLGARHVTVTGVVHTSRAAVVQAAGLQGAPPLIDVSTATVAARVQALPWVAQATVVRSFPDSVSIHVTERSALVAVSRRGGASALVDGTGRVLAWSAGPPPASMVQLVAPVSVGRPGTDLGPTADSGLAVARALPAALAGRVHVVTVSSTGDVTVSLGGGVTGQLGQARSPTSELAALASVLSGAPPTGPETIDVQVPGNPTVGAAQTTP